MAFSVCDVIEVNRNARLRGDGLGLKPLARARMLCLEAHGNALVRGRTELAFIFRAEKSWKAEPKVGPNHLGPTDAKQSGSTSVQPDAIPVHIKCRKCIRDAFQNIHRLPVRFLKCLFCCANLTR